MHESMYLPWVLVYDFLLPRALLQMLLTLQGPALLLMKMLPVPLSTTLLLPMLPALLPTTQMRALPRMLLTILGLCACCVR